jgi:cytochrome c553
MRSIIAPVILLSLFFTSTAKGANLFAGKATAAAVCSQCHGIKTPAAGAPFPPLAGRNAAYLRSALQQYRNKTRIAPIMNNIAGSLSDKDIANVTAYYAKLKP